MSKIDPKTDALAARLHEAEATIRRLKLEAQSEREKRQSIEKLLDDSHERIEKMRRVKFGVKASKQGVPKGSFLRTIICDTHGSHVDQAAISAFLADLEEIKPAEHIHLGDALECGGFLAQHMTLGYVAEIGTEGYETDIEAANWLLDEVAKRAPNAVQHQLEGNHENRVERWCITQSLRNGADARYLLRMHGAKTVLQMEKRGVNWWPADAFHMGLAVRGAIKLGSAHFTHGTAPGRKNTGATATRNLMKEFGSNVFHGHTHRAGMEFGSNVKSGPIVGASPGFLAQKQPYWMHGSLTGWSHGYGLQLVMPCGGFLHINVPIVDGVSYMRPLRERLM